MPDYRQLARVSLKRAKDELANGAIHRRRYAALELREAMEALTYDRARAYAQFLPPEAEKAWQPRKLMGALLEIDPAIGLTTTIAFGVEQQPGVRPEKMVVLGTDQVFTLVNLKDHYDALGSYLHVPSLADVKKGKSRDLDKLVERCNEIILLVEAVLSSPVWNNTIANVVTLDCCMNNACAKPIHKRMPFDAKTIDAQCFECKAEYIVTSLSNETVEWRPKTASLPCSNADCSHLTTLWPHEIQEGCDWRCTACGVRNVLKLGVESIGEQT